MVTLHDAQAANATVVGRQPLVAVFFGGTSGIGHYTLRALARETAQHGQGLRAYIVGRKAHAAEEIIAECRTLYPAGQYHFVQVEDLSLIRLVDQTCAKVMQMEERESSNPRIDYLMLSHACRPYRPRENTKEGIDITMSLMYYSRMRVILKLLPLLLNSTLPAQVVSVYAAGMEQKLFPDDLSLRSNGRYNYSLARSHMNFMHTVFFESLAEKHRGRLRLVHIFPGLVLGPGYRSTELPAWFRFIWNWIAVPLFGRFFLVPTEESGQRMLSLASSRYPARPIDDSNSQPGAVVGTDEKPGSGAYSLHWDGESKNIARAYKSIDKEDLRKKVWAHTLRAFEVIEKGGVFAE